MSKLSQRNYELSDSQEMILYMLKYSLHKQVIQIPVSITFDRKIDFFVLEKALNLEIARNDALRLRFIKSYFGVKQFFVESFQLEHIPILTFSSATEQEKVLGADAKKPISHFGKCPYRIMFFNSFDGKQGIYFNVSHLCMDAYGVFLFFSDLTAVYSSIEKGNELPKPLGSYELALLDELEIKNDVKMLSEDEKAFENIFLSQKSPVYLDLKGNGRLERARKLRHNPDYNQLPHLNPIFDKVKSLNCFASAEESKLIFDFCASFCVSPEVLLQTAMHIYLSRINSFEPDHCFITLCSRRNNGNTKHCGGNFVNALVWRNTLDVYITFSQALESMSACQCSVFRHQNYPFVRCHAMVKKLFTHNPVALPATMMFSWLSDTRKTGDLTYSYKMFNFGRYSMPVYTMASKENDTGLLKMIFLYKSHYYNENEIEKFFNGTVRAMLEGIKNPNETLQNIMQKQ